MGTRRNELFKYIIMGLLKKIFKKKNEIQPMRTERVGLSQRLKKPRKKNYIANVAITYEGKPIRQFKTNVKGWSRDNAAHKINEDLGLKLISVVKKRKGK